MCGAAAAAMAAPEPMPPVIAMARIRRSGRQLRADPAVAVDQLEDAVRRPASWDGVGEHVGAPGARSDGFRISVAPAASAPAVFLTASDSGAFHGTIASAGPHATWCTSMRRPSTTLDLDIAGRAQLGGGAAQLVRHVGGDEKP